MGASGSQAAAGQQSAKCQGAGRPGSALRAPALAAYLSEAAAPRPEVPCAPSQMGTLAEDGLEALRGREGFTAQRRTQTLPSKRRMPASSAASVISFSASLLGLTLTSPRVPLPPETAEIVTLEHVPSAGQLGAPCCRRPQRALPTAGTLPQALEHRHLSTPPAFPEAADLLR